jgi:hypothetical protein
MFSKLTFRTILLLCLALLFTAWNLLRAWTAFAWQDLLKEFSSQPAGWLIMLSGTIWAIAGLLLIWSLWQGKAWARKMLLGVAAGYSVWYWGGRLFWQIPRPNWPFAVILNLVLIIFIIWITKSPLREAHERES